MRALARVHGLVARLDRISGNPASRLRRHPLLNDSSEGESWIQTILPGGLPLDPEGPVFGEDSYEPISAALDALFPKGIGWLSSLLSKTIV